MSHRPDPQAFAEVDAAAKAFTDSRDLAEDAWQGWTSAERQRFLANLPRELDEAELAALDEALRLSDSKNNEVLFLWLELALENRNERVLPLAEEFLTRVGRAKFVRPLFATLMEQGDWGQPQCAAHLCQGAPALSLDYAAGRGQGDGQPDAVRPPFLLPRAAVRRTFDVRCCANMNL